MNVSLDGQLETLQIILDECCDRHDQCTGCKHLISCRKLWDKASEQAYSKPLTIEALLAYIDEFNLLWQEKYPGDDLFAKN